MRRWKAAVLAARRQWRTKRGRDAAKRRFAAGKDVAAHLSGYWEQVQALARQIYGGPKP